MMIAALLVQALLPKDFAELGAIRATVLPFPADARKKYPTIGSNISHDGNTVFNADFVMSAVFDMRSGNHLWDEKPFVSEVAPMNNSIVVTTSQGGHFKFSGRQRFTGIADMWNRTRWLIVCSLPSKGQARSRNLILADVDTTSRAFPPNRQVNLSFKPDPGEQDWSIVRTYFGADRSMNLEKAIMMKNHEVFFERWTCTVGDSVARRSKRAQLPNWSAKRSFVTYSDSVGRALYSETNGKSTHLIEWNQATRKFTPLPPSTHSIFRYWRGALMMYDYMGDDGLDLVSGDRRTLKHIGPYRWIAQSENERWLILQRIDDSTFWLLEFGKKPS